MTPMIDDEDDTVALAPELLDDVRRYARENGLDLQDAVNHLVKAGLVQLMHAPPTPTH